jgi:hypothetical protein
MLDDTPAAEQLTCRLLTIPRELRDAIIEYSLTSSEELHFRTPGKDGIKCGLSTTAPDDKEFREFNQIKYVNRQLHRETAGHEIKFNTVHFSTWSHQRGRTTAAAHDSFRTIDGMQHADLAS